MIPSPVNQTTLPATQRTRGSARLPGRTSENQQQSCAYTRSPLQDSRLFGPSPWKILALIVLKNGFLSNPAPGENLESGNLVMETGCSEVPRTTSSTFFPIVQRALRDNHLLPWATLCQTVRPYPIAAILCGISLHLYDQFIHCMVALC